MQEENEQAPVDVVEQEEITSEEAEESNDETVTLTKSEYSKLKRQAIAYKANKSEKPEVKETQTTTNAISEEDIEVKILISQGVDAELLEEMKALAKVRGKSILSIQNDPILIAMKEAKEEEARKKAARLGVSKGSSTVKATKSTTTPGLSEEDHKALWKEQNFK